MSKQLSEIIPPYPDEIDIQVCCGSAECGRPLGTYPFSGNPPQPRRATRKGRKVPRRGAALFTQEMSPDGRHVKATWYCGCGATPQKRHDRWGRMEVFEGKVARVYIT